MYKSNNPKFGYNLSNGGESHEGCHHSKETKKYLSDIQKGKKLSDETRKKMSESHKGLIRSESHIRNNAMAIQKKVLCVETGEIYPSIKQAAISCKTGPSHIIAVCKKRRKRAGGFSWIYVTEEVI